VRRGPAVTPQSPGCSGSPRRHEALGETIGVIAFLVAVSIAGGPLGALPIGLLTLLVA
jgi:hypothetical protein